MPSQDRPLSEVSSLIGRYRLLRPIGRGGFAQVYLAQDEETFAPYALKILNPNIDERIKEQVRVRFLAEERISKSIAHPAIVKIHETGANGEEPCFIAMEYIKGKPFCAYFQDMLAAPDESRTTYRSQDFLHEVARLAAHVASALASAHERNIVHRDLKPDNVLVTEADSARGRPSIKILDFGIAKAPVQLFSLAAPSVTRYWTELGTVMGSPPYMAPEQNGAAHTVTGKADVYALGVMLIITVFRLDYDAVERGQTTLCLPADLERLSLLAPPLPDGWPELLCRMIAEDPDERPNMRQVARKLGSLARQESDFARAVEAFFEQRKVPSTRSLSRYVAWSETTDYLSDDEAEFLRRAPLARLQKNRKFWLLSSTFCLLLAAGAGAGALLMQQERVSQALGIGDKARTPAAIATLSSQSTAKTSEVASPAKPIETAPAERGELDKLTALLSSNQSKLAAQLRVSEEQKLSLRNLSDKLASCSAAKDRLESSLEQQSSRLTSVEKQLDACRVEADEQAGLVSNCQHELSGKVQHLAESTDRLRVCSKSLRACASPAQTPAADEATDPVL